MKKVNIEKIDKALKNLAKEVKPDKKFMQGLEHKLSERFDELYQKQNLRSKWGLLFRFKLRLATTLSVLALTSTTIFAYQSESVTNGHILYPLKRGAEKVEGFFANTPQEKFEFQEKIRQRRVEELYYIKINNPASERLERINNEIKQTIEIEIGEFKKLPKAEKKIIHERLKKNLRKLEKEKPKKDKEILKITDPVRPIKEDTITRPQIVLPKTEIIVAPILDNKLDDRIEIVPQIPKIDTLIIEPDTKLIEPITTPTTESPTREVTNKTILPETSLNTSISTTDTVVKKDAEEKIETITTNTTTIQHIEPTREIEDSLELEEMTNLLESAILSSQQKLER